jgi:CheY-specific phosphatase CheX
LDPLLDEKIILTVSRILPGIFLDTLGITAIREAYGPSRNEGLCYEKCTTIELTGEFDGNYYLGLDGYTKTKLLPYIARSFNMASFSQISSSLVLMEFTNLICGKISDELTSAGFKLDITTPKNLDNKLIAIDLYKYRQYIIIYFLQDKTMKKYLGRIYTILTLKKYDPELIKSLVKEPIKKADFTADSPVSGNVSL